MRPTYRLLISLAVLALLLAPVTPARASSPTIMVDGTALPADVPAVVNGDHILVPLRGVLERLGAQVAYDPVRQVASAALNGVLVQVRVGTNQGWVNGQPKTLDIGAREIAGRVMIPLRFVADALGVAVDYDDQSNTIVIVSGFKPGNFAAMTSGPTLSVASKLAPTVEDLRPASGALIGAAYPTIYARFNGGTSPVNPSSVRITLDGTDISDQATISSAYFSYTPSVALSTGAHNVSVAGTADDGSPFAWSWSFRVDVGTSTDYTVGTYGGGGLGYLNSPFYGYNGFGWRFPGFSRFGFFPPGFSCFTPGALFFTVGGIIPVYFFNPFFPTGVAFFTISGIPGSFPLTPWLGHPGFFWGYAHVPVGVVARNAVLATHFRLPSGHTLIVHSTAPLQILGDRKTLPSGLRYAVIARPIAKPTSPTHLVAFERLEPANYQNVRLPMERSLNMQNPEIHFSHTPTLSHELPSAPHEDPIVLHPAPLHPMLQPGMAHAPAFHMQMPQWQNFGGFRPAMPAMPAPVAPAHPR